KEWPCGDDVRAAREAVIRSAPPRYRLFLALLALCGVGPHPFARAQSLFDTELRLAPQYLLYQVHEPADETIAELAIPIFVTVPAGSRLSFDIGTAYARARVTSGALRSEISGLTDTQIRGVYTLGGDFVVLTAGVNLPTGESSVNADQFLAAGRIGNDFLAFPISSMGTGLALTGGVAIARPFGEWSVGAGLSARRSRAYDPFEMPGESLRYQPGDEVRVRLGVDRPRADGRLALGVTYAAFGRDDVSGSAYNTGDRVIAQGVLTGLAGGHDWTVAAYNVFHAPGEYASGERAGRENVASLFMSVGLHTVGTIVEPSLEVRHWRQQVFDTPGQGSAEIERSQSSRLATVALRTRAYVRGLVLFPSAGYTIFGKLATEDIAGRPVSADLTGFHVGLVMRATP
ncbi:MAG TPA: hypothetical protein VJT85_08260, partial [Gemmatimonadaceae bacterium]|nr:hypothetical protein [Gemmatimonadaceae bacterium]